MVCDTCKSELLNRFSLSCALFFFFFGFSFIMRFSLVAEENVRKLSVLYFVCLGFQDTVDFSARASFWIDSLCQLRRHARTFVHHVFRFHFSEKTRKREFIYYVLCCFNFHLLKILPQSSVGIDSLSNSRGDLCPHIFIYVFNLFDGFCVKLMVLPLVSASEYALCIFFLICSFLVAEKNEGKWRTNVYVLCCFCCRT